MKLHHYSETGSLYIELNARPTAESQEIADGVVLDVVAEGRPVGIDIDGASARIDLGTLELIPLPTASTRVAG